MPGLRFVVLCQRVCIICLMLRRQEFFPQERILPFAEGAPRDRARKAHGHGSRRILVRRREGLHFR